MTENVIAFYIVALGKGGAERVLCNLANAYANKGFKVYVLTDFKVEEEYTDLHPSIERYVIPTPENGMRIMRVRKRVMWIRNFLLEHHAKYLVSFMRKCNLRAVQAVQGTDIRVILSVRSAPEREYQGFAKRILAKHYFRKADGAVFQTEQARDFFPRSVRKKSVVLMNSVKPDFLIPRYEGEREKEIVTAGRMDVIKNHPLIVQAFDQIKDKYPSHVVRIYGGGKNEALEKLIHEKGLEDRVFLMGGTDDIIGAIRKASLFILSSNMEGMPNALIEAMSLGLPCISTDCPCGGPASMIEDGKNGLLVPVGDVAAMAQAMDRVLSDESYAQSLGRAAVQIQERIHPNKVNQMWMDYIEEGKQC